MKYVGFGVLALIAILGLSWIATGNDFFLYKVFAPRMEAVRRQTFEQTKSYRQGMIQDLYNMEHDYTLATAEQKKSLGYIVLHRFADFDESALPIDLKAFMAKVRREQGE